LPPLAGVRLSLRNRAQCVTFTDAAAGADFDSHFAAERSRQAHAANHFATAHANANAHHPVPVAVRSAAHHQSVLMVSASHASSHTAGAPHRLVDDVAVAPCRGGAFAQRLVFDQRTRQLWAAGDAPLGRVDVDGGTGFHAWLPRRSRFCLEADGVDAHGVERVAWKHCQSLVGDEFSERTVAHDVRRVGSAFVHQQWEWMPALQTLRSTSLDKCVGVRGLDDGGGSGGGSSVRVVIDGDAPRSAPVSMPSALPHLVLVLCTDAPRWEVSFF
jgi:hypothetical protein